MFRGEKSCSWEPGTADDEQEEKANPRAAVRRVESFRDQKQVVRKACEPLSEVRECWPVHPSLPYTISGFSILISGVVQTQT